MFTDITKNLYYGVRQKTVVAKVATTNVNRNSDVVSNDTREMKKSLHEDL